VLALFVSLSALLWPVFLCCRPAGLSTSRIRANIGWGIDDGTFIITWTERNGTPASPPKRRGFAAVVMETMAARSVDGTVDLDYASSGVTWRLACRAANALSPREAGGLSWSVDQRNG
jgi:hypothetical protein